MPLPTDEFANMEVAFEAMRVAQEEARQPDPFGGPPAPTV
jgi:hypothetical protein